ncbi:MAG TPA: amino acid adenylation domain-containing protein [Herpetosiphonaceae bacterium]
MNLDDLGDTAGYSDEQLELLAYLMAEEGLDSAPRRTIVARERRDDPPLSFAQERLWFIDRYEPGNLAYTVPLTVRLTGSLDRAALQRALDSVVQRHEALRTTFPMAGDQPVQRIAPSLSIPLPLTELEHLPLADREPEALRQVEDAVRQPFDLVDGPLIKARLFRIAEREHIFFLNIHHIIFDGWSMGLFIDEVTTLYAAYVTGADVSLPELPIHYADFTLWQREWLQGDVLRQQLDYWLEQLHQPLPVLELPTDRPRPLVQTSRGAAEPLVLAPSLVAALTQLSQDEDATLFMTLLAAFNVLLGRYSGQDDIIVGSPIANRDMVELENMMGFFVNTLLLRTDLSGNPGFRELLRRVQRTTLAAYSHQNVPFEQLVEALRPERDLSHTPLFQVMFILQNAPMPAYALPDLTLTPVQFEVGTAKFDLLLGLSQPIAGIDDPAIVDGGLIGSLEYNSDLFDGATIRRMLAHFQTLLEQIVAAPDRPIAELSLLTADERALLQDWTALVKLPPDSRCVHQLIEEQAARNPQAVAVVDEGRQVSYAELNRRANQLAHHLQTLGVGLETRVGLLIERSPEMLVGLLGVLKAGAAYVPLDPAYPQERIALMLRDAGIGVLLTQGHLADRQLEPAAQIIRLDADWPSISRMPDHNPDSVASAASLAYVMYTSGSTGAPKGVMIPHQSLVNYVQSARAAYGVSAGDRILQFASFSFDTSAEEIYLALATGATLFLRNQDMLAIPVFLETCAAWQITALSLPTAYWHELVALAEAQDLALPLTLRVMIIGGERALPERLDQWRRWTGDRVRLLNTYGPTEATIVATAWDALHDPKDPVSLREVPIGRALGNVQTYVLGANLQPQPIGVPGELYIGGAGLARGYHERPDLTAERFIPNPFAATSAPGSRLYTTGDRARYLADGSLEFLGRADDQVKIRGFRVEPGEIAAALRQHPQVRDAIVVAQRVGPGEQRLVAYVTEEPRTKNQEPRIPEQRNKETKEQSTDSFPSPAATDAEAGGGSGKGSRRSDGVRAWGESLSTSSLRSYLGSRLPAHMIPAAFLVLDTLPLTPSGKIDRRALPDPEPRSTPEATYVMPSTPLEQTIAEVWRHVLQLDRVGAGDNFFDLGGHSLRLIQVQSQLQNRLQREIPLLDLFRYPTIRALADHLGAAPTTASIEPKIERKTPTAQPVGHATDIAIIAVAGRFPGAPTVEQLWHNLRAGVESVTFFSDHELRQAAIDPTLLSNPAYVKARAFLPEIEQFDASFFGYSPREAEVMDPQQRFFLECAWEALERAGYPPTAAPSSVGVFAGVGTSGYQLNLFTRPDILASAGTMQVSLGSEKDHITTRVGYKLNLRGPCVTVQTACSTSLVAVHLACQSLRQDECRMALAGGASIVVPQVTGTLYQEGGILSPDGHCRAFDAQAQGTVSGSGVGIVVLKRLADAIEDGDSILAVIKGSAINNDGANKVGYTAPSIDGQAEVIQAALAMAGVAPETIGYIEAHGTGTRLGDPIEVAALRQVFGSAGAEHRCALGSIKTNLGHLDTAAGVTGLIKAVLALHHGQIPPSLHFSAANPALSLDSSTFYVNTSLRNWSRTDQPRRAGVSSFGIGGTNAHVVLEEAPPLAPTTPGHQAQLLVLSAKTETALEAATNNLIDYLEHTPAIDLADVAYTLHVGRAPFQRRRMLVCRDREDAIAALKARDPQRLLDHAPAENRPAVVFMFPGQGAQYADMSRDLYASQPEFRRWIDRCAELLEPYLDLRAILYPGEHDSDAATLGAVSQAHPALFAVEYALARLWISWGVQPAAMIGHSVGEYVAATLAGVFPLEDALALIVARSRLLQQTAAGAMLSVPLSEADLRPFLDANLTLAAINGPSLCVVSGPIDAVAALEQQLIAQGLEPRRVASEVAAHSPLVEPIADALREFVATLTLHPPQIPFISNVSGTWITVEQATDPRYWATHLHQTVRFADGIARLREDPGRVLLEVGPGRILSTLARLQATPDQPIITSLRHPQDHEADDIFLLSSLGKLWLAGVAIDWAAVHRDERRRRILLPTYPFERQRYWVEPNRTYAETARQAPRLTRQPDLADWLYVPTWQRSTPPSLLRHMTPEQHQPWIVLLDGGEAGAQIVERLHQTSAPVIVVRRGEHFGQTGERAYTIDPRQPEHYTALLAELSALALTPRRALHLWTLTHETDLADAQTLGCDSLLFLAQALDRFGQGESIDLWVVASQTQDVLGGDVVQPTQAIALGPCRALPLDYPHLRCCHIDLALPVNEPAPQALVEQLMAELTRPIADSEIAYRARRRWVQRFEAVRLEPADDRFTRLRDGGVYLITGGLSAIGLVLARALATAAQIKLVLVDEAERIGQQPGAITELRAQGADVVLLSADLSDPGWLSALWEQASLVPGELSGVIHAADVAAAPDALALTMRQVQALNELCHAGTLDFVVVCSSIAGILPRAGEAVASAASVFLDAWTSQISAQGTFAVAIDWERWDDAALSITPAEGAEIFRRVLAQSLPQVIVSPLDLEARRAYNATSAPDEQPIIQTTGYARPAIGTQYVAPRNEIEQGIAEIWEQLLGIAQIGVYDNFFEIGGHSLLATQLLSRIRDMFGADISMISLFETPSVAEMAALIVRQRAESVDQDQLAQLLAEIQGLSPEDALSLLADEDLIQTEDRHE